MDKEGKFPKRLKKEFCQKMVFIICWSVIRNLWRKFEREQFYIKRI